jgi:methylated-DNA-[protein]-cysteine S-methyltransferase
MEQLFWGGSGNTPLGAVWTAISDKGLVAVQIGGDEGDFTQGLAARFGAPLSPAEDQIAPIMQQIEAYLAGRRKIFEIPIHWEVMSHSQQKVLRVVYAIPFGETHSYGQIAAQIGKPRAARAVGRANATNPMPLVIPCHRVVGADGSLRGYRGGEGVKTKAWLLDLERSE